MVGTMKRTIITLLAIAGVLLVYSFETQGTLERQAGIVDDMYIVRTVGSVDCEQISPVLEQDGFKFVETLVSSMNICLFKSEVIRQASDVMENLNVRPYIIYSQPDHILTLRETLPNDPSFDKLWSLKQDGPGHISATQAWDLGTGGKDFFGNDIVVAVVDSGMDLTQPDLVDNIWVNTNEIPDNSIDDDNNGYVDDINGWNAYSNTGSISSSSHGTHVAGIVGARGDNNTLITGVNWNVKIMAVPASSRTTSVVVKGYGYIIDQKKLWFESNGEKGANIVATNSSFGVDKGDCESSSYMVWNDLYNKMGELGILSAAATANSAWNIDLVGDVPTGCKSEHIVSVTNTTNQNKLYYSAGYGLESVDLGAPGTSVYSTLPGTTAGAKTGTSMATPHVAGAVAFLHSVANEKFAKLYSDAPAEAALVLKSIMMATVDPVASLDGKTVSGGRLNLEKAAQAISNY
jgi:subtilisin family serine protease